MALYHKHRPQIFARIVGQEHIVRTLRNQVATGKVAHAYLFSGPRGVGKTTSARILAKAINCPARQEGDFEPCNQCNQCKEISGSASIDVIEMDAASHTGVENVRENIIENAQFRPTKSKYKIFIIDEAHMLSGSSFNALLKTLEEPPAHVIFILATTEKHKLPDTIISRCQRFDFKKIPYETMKKYLEAIAKVEGVKVDKEVIDRLINKSDGCARDAVSLLDQLMATGDQQITSDTASLLLPTANVEETLAFVTALIERDAKTCLTQINQLVSDGVNLPQFAHDVIELLRVMLISKANSQTQALGLDLSDKVKKEIRNYELRITNYELVKLIDLLIKRRLEIKSAPIPQLPLELAVIEWCGDDMTRDTGNMTHDPDSMTHDTNNITQKTTTPETVEKMTLKEKAVELIPPEPSFTLEQARAAWKDCLKKLESLSPALTFILTTAALKEVRGHTLYAEVQYRFHRDKIMEAGSYRQIQSVLSEQIGSPVQLEVNIPPAAQEKNELQALATAFGGEVVN